LTAAPSSSTPQTLAFCCFVGLNVIWYHKAKGPIINISSHGVKFKQYFISVGIRWKISRYVFGSARWRAPISFKITVDRTVDGFEFVHLKNLLAM
jgi:hypothetical protein